MIGVVAHHLRRPLGVVAIAHHQADRPAERAVEPQADLTFGALGAGEGIEQHHVVPGHRPAHRAGLEALAGGVADLQSALGLAETVAHRQPPCPLDLLDHLRVERLTRTDDLAQRDPAAEGSEIGLHEHPPHSGRSAESRCAATLHGRP